MWLLCFGMFCFTRLLFTILWSKSSPCCNIFAMNWSQICIVAVLVDMKKLIQLYILLSRSHFFLLLCLEIGVMEYVCYLELCFLYFVRRNFPLRYSELNLDLLFSSFFDNGHCMQSLKCDFTGVQFIDCTYVTFYCFR